MKQTTMKNRANDRRTISAVLLGASLLSSPLLHGCVESRPALEARCDSENISITWQRYQNALDSMGASKDDAFRRSSEEYVCPPGRFAKNSQDVSWFRRSNVDLAESCSDLGVPLWGFNKLQKLVYFDGQPGNIAFSVPVRDRDPERRQKCYERLQDALKIGIQALELGGSHKIVRLDSISLAGDEIRVEAVADFRGTVAKQ